MSVKRTRSNTAARVHARPGRLPGPTVPEDRPQLNINEADEFDLANRHV